MPRLMMGRFETEVLTQEANLNARSDLSGRWIDAVQARRPVKAVVLDINSSVCPTYGEQEGSANKGHFGCTCYHPLVVFNQFGDLERCALRPPQRPRCRGLEGRAGAGGDALSGKGEAVLLPSRCGFHLAGGLLLPGGGELQVCHPPACQCG